MLPHGQAESPFPVDEYETMRGYLKVCGHVSAVVGDSISLMVGWAFVTYLRVTIQMNWSAHLEGTACLLPIVPGEVTRAMILSYQSNQMI